MKAFHGKKEIKEKYLARVKAHASADEIIRGKYWEDGRGCAVGCTIHGSDHEQYEVELGIPIIIARLEDLIFEGLPLEQAKTWPVRFLESIKVGADLSLIWGHFASRLLTDPIGGVIQYAKTKEQLEVIQRVSDLYEARIEGLEVDKQDFRDAAAAVYAAVAADDADAAAANAAVYAANDAAVYAAVAAAAAAAAAVYAANDADDAKQKAYLWQSELLLELLRKAK